MWKRLVLATITVPALMVIAGCTGPAYGGTVYSTPTDPAPAYSAPGYSTPSKFAPASGTPKDSGAPKEEKEQRGNTPVGKDRMGGGPADGAILDPTGAVTKEPVLRDR